MNQKAQANLTRMHSALGVFTGCGLIVIFLFGSLLFFRTNLMHWQLDWQQYSPSAIPLSYAQIKQKLEGQFPSINDTGMYLMDYGQDARYHAVYLRHQNKNLLVLVDRVDGTLVSDIDKSQTLADFLYFFHKDLVTPLGEDILGFLSLLLVVITFSGIIIRYRQLWAKFYQYRLGKIKDSLKDAHILLSLSLLLVLLIFGLSSFYLTMGEMSSGPAVLFNERDNPHGITNKLGQAKTPTSKGNHSLMSEQAIARAQQGFYRDYPDHQISRFIVSNSEQRGYFIRILADAPGLTESNRFFYYDAHGQLVSRDQTHVQTKVSSFWTEIHEGDFAGYHSKIPYALLGLMMTAAMILGNLVWVVKQRALRQPSYWQRGKLALVQTLTLGPIAVLASAVLLARYGGDAGLDFHLYEKLMAVIFLGLFGYFCLLANKYRGTKYFFTICSALFVLTPLLDLSQLIFADNLHLQPDWLLISGLWLTLALFTAGLSHCFSAIESKASSARVTI